MSAPCTWRLWLQWREESSVLFTCLFVGQRPECFPKYKPYLFKRRHLKRLYVIDWDMAIETLDFCLTPNGSVLCYSTVPAELLVRIIDMDNDLHTFVFPMRKKSKRDLEPPMSIWTTEPRFLSVSQILHENTRTHLLVKCACCEKKNQKRARYFVHAATNWEDRQSQAQCQGRFRRYSPAHSTQNPPTNSER